MFLRSSKSQTSRRRQRELRQRSQPCVEQLESRVLLSWAPQDIRSFYGFDRIQFGKVADFFSFHVGSFQWYIFNLADVAIVAGVAGLLSDSLSHKSAGKEA